MIKELVQQWNENKNILEDWFKNTPQKEYLDYDDIVKQIFTKVVKGYEVKSMTIIDNGEYQGDRIFILPKSEYQPSVKDYIVINISYGSCSQCDTITHIREYSVENSWEIPTEKQVDMYMLLALHMIQNATILKDEDEDELSEYLNKIWNSL